MVLKRADREDQILNGAKTVCADAGLELVEDAGLLSEVAGLVEHPVPVLGEMDPEFLDLPPEVITLTMKVHQKYFAVRDPKTGKLAPKFVMIANQEAPDGGKAIAEGAARVLSARLSDARHFWDIDLRSSRDKNVGVSPLDEMVGQLEDITFHAELGTVADRTARLIDIAAYVGKAVGADGHDVWTAAHYSKADLVSQMVYEFPELQGTMGGYYALATGCPRHVAEAIRDHYKPIGPNDLVPEDPVSISVAIADKIEALVGFWWIDNKPTGSKDPFALRRAALGVIRLCLENKLRLPLAPLIDTSIDSFVKAEVYKCENDLAAYGTGDEEIKQACAERERAVRQSFDGVKPDLLSFFADRLKVHLKDEGVRHDVIDAVFALGDDDLVRVTKKARALQDFLSTEDGAALLAGYRRAANILKAEEKKGFDLTAARAEALSEISAEAATGTSAHGPETASQDDTAILVAVAKTAQAPEEKALVAAIEGAEEVAGVALAREDFEGAMKALAGLRAPVDAFFEAVVVNAENAMLRRNRLLLLSRIRSAVGRVADFDRLEG